jgi:hypothetical protein
MLKENVVLPPFHKEYNSSLFSNGLVVAWKNFYTLICLPHAVSFDVQIKSDHLIRQVVEIQFRSALFLGR